MNRRTWALVAFCVVGYAGCFGLYATRPSKEPPAPLPTISAAPPVNSAPVPDAPAPAPGAASTPAVDPTAPTSTRTPEGLVRAAVGRWRGDSGMIIEVDPIREREGSRPPYHLVVRGKGGTRTFGCDFTDDLKTHQHIDQSEIHYRAWCGGEGKAKSKAVSVLGLTVDSGLYVSLVVDGKSILPVEPLAKQSPEPARFLPKP